MNERYIRLGKSDLIVSRIGISAFFWKDLSVVPRFNINRSGYGLVDNKVELRKAVECSLSAGVNFIDIGEVNCRRPEFNVGELINDKEFIISTRFTSSFKPWAGDILKNIDEILNRLERKSIDLLQVYCPFYWISIPQILKEIVSVVEKGKVKAVGVSNFTARQMRYTYKLLEESGVCLVSNQVEYSLLHRNPETNGVLDTCRELGITLIANMPLRMGALTGKYSMNTRPTGMRKFMSPFISKDFDEFSQIMDLLNEIANKYSKKPSHIAIQWLMQHENVLPLPGVKNSEQANQNAEALNFVLTESEIDDLNHASMKFVL